MKKLLLIDGNSLMFRAYYATGNSGNIMKNSKGLHTNCIFAFSKMLMKIISMDFTHIMIAYDFGSKTFRHEKLESYKAGRLKMPDEFREQIPYIYELIEKMGILYHKLEFIEADDIIGTLAEKHYGDFSKIDIITGDKDLLQLINDKVKVAITRKGVSELEVFDTDSLMEKMEVTPEQVKDLKGLMGDASDNLKGIPGVGQKTAIKLLKEYKTLEKLIECKDEVTGKLGDKIRDNIESAILCKEIGTIKCDVSLDITLDEMEYKGFKKDELLKFYGDLELHSLARTIDVKKEEDVVEEELDFEILTAETFTLNKISNISSLHLEVFGENYHKGIPIGFGLNSKGNNYYIKFEEAMKSSAFSEYLSNDNYRKYVFDLKKIYVILLKENEVINGVDFDLLLGAYVLNQKLAKEEFKVISSTLGYDEVMYDENVFGKGVKACIPSEKLISIHIVKKSIAILELKNIVCDELMKNDQLDLMMGIELPLSIVLAKMEFEGIKVDRSLLLEYKDKYSVLLKELESIITEYAGEKFNISSTKQLGVILFERLNLKIIKKTKTGYSTSVDVLEKLKNDHPIINKIMEYRQLSKLKSTYVDGLEKEMYEDDKVRTIYKQAFTETGRLSSVFPNLQNIPTRTKEGREIRKLFVASKEGNVFIGSDYSQVELRILAHMSETVELIDAYNNNEDIHEITAMKIFDTDKVTHEQRSSAKTINFGIIYGMSAYGLSEGINITAKEAKVFIDKYLKTYPGIKLFMDKTIDECKYRGYVNTIFNRRRYIPEINSSNHMQREFGKRTAMNAPIQGSAADIIKVAMIKIDYEIKNRNLDSKLILQVHDELIFEVVENEIEIMNKLIKNTMETCVKLKVNLTANIMQGSTWYDLK